MAKKKEFDYISLKKLKVWSDVNVRHTDAYDHIEELADNIGKIGVEVPLVVTPYKSNFRIISGQRRFIAAGKAGLSTVPCRIVYDVTKTEGRILSFSENVYRSDMNEEDKAEAAYQLKKELGSVSEVAGRLGVSTSSVYNYLGYRNVFPQIRQLVKQKKIIPSVALHIYRKYTDNEEFACKLAEDYASRGGDKSDYFAAIKDAKPGENIAEIRKRFTKYKSTNSYTIRLPKSSSDIVEDLAKQTNSKQSFVIVQLVEQSIQLWKKGKVNL